MKIQNIQDMNYLDYYSATFKKRDKTTLKKVYLQKRQATN
jgi:hypothetical protein